MPRGISKRQLVVAVTLASLALKSENVFLVLY